MVKMFLQVCAMAAVALMVGVAPAQEIESSQLNPTSPPSIGTVPSVLGDRKLPAKSEVELTSGTYAIFHTSEGDFIAALADSVAPVTVRNFIAYATGQKAWRHPVTLTETRQPLYSNTTIYRTVPNAMIYGGDPMNRGEADSGTQLPLEVQPDVQFDQPGLLAMDSSGDKMSGSRWFITLRPFPDRNGNYTIFGRVIGGLDLVQRISNKPVKRPQLPLDPVMIYFVEIVKVPAGRVTTGEFKNENGMTVLRINPNFQDAPTGSKAANVFAKDKPTSMTVVENGNTTEPVDAADDDDGVRSEPAVTEPVAE
jgi:peptidyl-prolyl cis-trans isomerase A (cyclophilin A)